MIGLGRLVLVLATVLAGVTADAAVGTTSTTTATTTTETTTSTTTSTTTAAGASTTTTTTTSVAPVTTTTTTIAGGAVERCGNCVDDDGDGRVDWADDDCCSGPRMTLTAKRVRIKPLGAQSMLRVRGVLGALDDASPSTHDLVLQVDFDGGLPAFCGAVPPGGFTAQGRRYRWKDPAGAAPASGGLDKVTMRMAPAGAVVKIRGKHASFVAPPPGPLDVTLVMLDDAGAHCASVPVTLRRRGKVLRGPWRGGATPSP